MRGLEYTHTYRVLSLILILALLLQLVLFFSATEVTQARVITYGTPDLTTFVTNEHASSNASTTVAAPEGLAVGDVVVACVTTDKDFDELTTRKVEWPTGFTSVVNETTATGDDIGSLVAYKVIDATTTETSYRFGYPSNNADFSVIVAAFRGVNSIDPFDASSTATGVDWSDTTDANPAVTTSNDNALVVLCAHHSNNNISEYIPPTAATLVTERKSSNENLAMAYFTQDSPGSTGSQQFTTTGESGAEEWHVHTVAFNAQESFNYKTKQEYTEATTTTWTVPDKVYEIEVKAWGAGGGGGKADSNSTDVVGGHGGGSAFVYGRIGVTPGEILNIEVGGGGATGTNGTNAGEGAGGGGHTEIARGSHALVIAGGGGGGGGSSNAATEDGGDGGAAGADQGQQGDSEQGASQSLGGRGGHQTAGGTGGSGDDGASQTGGDGDGSTTACDGSDSGTGGAGGSTSGGDGGVIYNAESCGGAGGGGSGYFGGEGGEVDGRDHAGGGGGGGSSWASSTAVSNIVKKSGIDRGVGLAADPDLHASGNPAAGVGGFGENREDDSYTASAETNQLATDGNDGLLIIKYRAIGEVSGQTNIMRDVDVTGDTLVARNIAKSSGTFVIDHPLDPANKLLYHSFVESPEAKNIYDGVAELDWRGEATITLPDYFEVLNIDYRYQFTPLNESMPNLHLKKAVSRNRFVIAGGAPGGNIAWQVTGVRNDPYIQANPIINEVEKGPDAILERGEYLFNGYNAGI